MTNFVIKKVTTPQEFKALVELPWRIYKDYPNWVPPLVSARRKLLDKSKNPSWEYLTGEYFMAWRGTEPIGSIAAFINTRHNQTWNENIGWFGCFDCIDEQNVATALLTTARQYLQDLGGYTTMRGPATFTCNDEHWGLLIENYEQPVLLMPYHPPYYRALIENSGLGLEKVMDVVSYYLNPEIIFHENGQMPAKLVRVVTKTMERNGITVRMPERSHLAEELALLREIYVAAWEKNWGNVPPTDKEMDALFSELKDYFVPEMALFVYVHGKIAGFFLALPDMNQVLQHAYPNPREPEIITLLKALWHWKIRPKITWQRVLLFGIKPEYRSIGVDAVCFMKYFEQVRTSPYRNVDAGWVLETNSIIHNSAKTFGAQLYRRYRFYETSLVK